MRCDHCGIEQRAVLGTTNTHCAPPFARQRHAFTGKHPADVFAAGSQAFPQREPLDTSTLGPIRHEPKGDAMRAQVVREALCALANDDVTDPAAAYYLSRFACDVNDAALLKLARMLR